jgi:Mce-associated membrane protein
MEGDAGTRQLNPTDAQDTPDDSVAAAEQEQTGEQHQDGAAAEVAQATARGAESSEGVDELGDGEFGGRRPPRLGRGWMAAICAGLVALSIAAVVGGVLLIRDNRGIDQINRNDAAALQAAKECVTALQAPDTAAMSAAQMKIMECSTGAFGAQASMFGGVLVEAYQAANAKVQVSDMRAAVERHNPDGSVDVLVAARVKVTNSAATDQESGYRLRVTMTPDEGQYRIDKMEQVTS